MDIVPENPNFPQILGKEPVTKASKPANRPGRPAGQSPMASLCRQILDQLEDGQATVIGGFEDKRALRRFQNLLHNVDRYVDWRPYKPVNTKTKGLTLRVWEQAQ